jgi:lysophospholipase L1-like esterase
MGAEFYGANYTQVFLKVVCRTIKKAKTKGVSMKKIITSLFLLFLCNTLLFGASMQQKTILAFGDSITYGYGAKSTQSYPAKLQELAKVTVINAGICGENSHEAVIRLPQLLAAHPEVNIMILAHGANDILHHGSKKELEKNITTMVQEAKKRGIKILLIGIPNFNLQALEVLPLYKNISQKEQTAYEGKVLLDIESQASLKSDAVHPNAKGYSQMAERIYQTLKKANLL